MLRFILAVLFVAVLLKIGQDDPQTSFLICLTLSLFFVVYTNLKIDKDDIEFERKMLRTPESRRRYYRYINSQ